MQLYTLCLVKMLIRCIISGRRASDNAPLSLALPSHALGSNYTGYIVLHNYLLIKFHSRTIIYYSIRNLHENWFPCQICFLKVKTIFYGNSIERKWFKYFSNVFHSSYLNFKICSVSNCANLNWYHNSWVTPKKIWLIQSNVPCWKLKDRKVKKRIEIF